MNKRLTRIGKYLTFILRHQPDTIGVTLEPDGWLNIDELIRNANAHGKSITHAQIHEIVAQDGGRFSVSDDGLRIRALASNGGAPGPAKAERGSEPGRSL